eukprot:PhM_4_TR1283/c1_g1_i1/m.7317
MRQAVHAVWLRDAAQWHGAVAGAVLAVSDGLERDPPGTDVDVRAVDGELGVVVHEQGELALTDLGDGADRHELDADAGVVDEVSVLDARRVGSQAAEAELVRVAEAPRCEGGLVVVREAEVALEVGLLRRELAGGGLNQQMGETVRLGDHGASAGGGDACVLERDVELAVVQVRTRDCERLGVVDQDGDGAVGLAVKCLDVDDGDAVVERRGAEVEVGRIECLGLAEQSNAEAVRCAVEVRRNGELCGRGEMEDTCAALVVASPELDRRLPRLVVAARARAVARGCVVLHLEEDATGVEVRTADLDLDRGATEERHNGARGLVVDRGDVDDGESEACVCNEVGGTDGCVGGHSGGANDAGDVVETLERGVARVRLGHGAEREGAGGALGADRGVGVELDGPAVATDVCRGCAAALGALDTDVHIAIVDVAAGHCQRNTRVHEDWDRAVGFGVDADDLNDAEVQCAEATDETRVLDAVEVLLRDARDADDEGLGVRRDCAELQVREEHRGLGASGGSAV